MEAGRGKEEEDGVVGCAREWRCMAGGCTGECRQKEEEGLAELNSQMKELWLVTGVRQRWPSEKRQQISR
ncbi:hypothetical protein AAC387_Pa11g0685 [Persea americana]